MATPNLTVPPSPLIRTKGPADVPISPSPAARIGPTGNVGASGPTTDKRGNRRCFRDGMPIGCIEMNAEVKDLAESDVAVKEPEEKPKPVRRTQQRQPAQPQQQPRQETVQPRNPQVQPSQRRPVPTDRLARETLRNVTDGDYSDRDRQQVSELAERVGEEGHRQAANRLQHAASHRGGDNARWQAERGTRRYLRDIGQIRDDPNRSAPVGERGTAPQEQIRQPAPDEQYAGGREPRQESSKEEYLQEKEGVEVRPEFRLDEEVHDVAEVPEEEEYGGFSIGQTVYEMEDPDDPGGRIISIDRENGTALVRYGQGSERTYDLGAISAEPEDLEDEEPDYNYREEQNQHTQAATDFGYSDWEEAVESGIEDPKQFEKLREFGIESKEVLDGLGGGSALKGSQTRVSVGSRGLDIRVSHPYVQKCRRTLEVDRKGNSFIHNEIFRLRKNAPKGTGLRVFEDEVRTAIELGVSYIKTHAAGDYDRREEWNGYYTWAVFGYNQNKDQFDSDYDEEFLEKWEEDWPEAESVQDILDQDGGTEWWLKNGIGMEEAVFDLSEKSRSRQVLEEYIAYKKEKGEYIEGQVKSYFVKALEDIGINPISIEEADDFASFRADFAKQGKSQPGVPFQGPSGKWFVYSQEHNRVVPTKDPNAVEEEQPQADPQFQEDWNQVAEQAINEIEQADVSDYQYTAQEVAAEQDWHRQLIEWRGSGSEPAPQDAGIISRAISGFLNPSMGVGYVDGLVREFAIPNQKDDITQGLLAELDRINPGGKGNAIIASLVGWLFGSPAVAVTKAMPQGKVKQPKQGKTELPNESMQEQPSDSDDPTEEELRQVQVNEDEIIANAPDLIKARIAKDPAWKTRYLDMIRRRGVGKHRANKKQERIDKETPEEKQARELKEQEALMKRHGRQRKRADKQRAIMFRRAIRSNPQLKQEVFDTLHIRDPKEIEEGLAQLDNDEADRLFEMVVERRKSKSMVWQSKVMESPFIKSRGQPCKRGETAKATGCIPRSKVASAKKPSSPKVKPKTSQPKKTTTESVEAAKKAVASGDSTAINNLLNELQASTGKKGIAVAGLQKIAKHLGIAPGKLKKAGLVLSIMDKLKVSRPGNDLRMRLDTIKRAEKGTGASYTDRLISAAIGAPSMSYLTPEEKQAYRSVDTTKPEGKSTVKAIRKNVLERMLKASEPIPQSLLDGLGVEGYGWLKADEVLPYLKGELKPHDPTVPKEGEVLPDEFKILTVKGGTKKQEVSPQKKQDYLDRLLKEPVKDRVDYVKRAEKGEGISFMDRLVSGFIFNPKTGATLDQANRVKYADLVKRAAVGGTPHMPQQRDVFYNDSEQAFVRKFRNKVLQAVKSHEQQENTAIILEQLSDQGYGSLKVNELEML